MPQAIVADEPGGPDVLKIQEVPAPNPGPHQLLVKIAATGVNFIEIYQRSGVYPVPFPFTPGAEMAGTVEAIGAEVTDFAPGDRIATAGGTKTYADYALVDADKAITVPESLDLETAAALPLQGMTAHYLCNSTYPATPGETALVHAGAGGVGLLLTQMLKTKGVTVFTTVSTEEKAQLSREAGADDVFDYQDFAEKTRAATDGRGVNVVYDGVGKTTFQGSLDSLSRRGMLVVYGGASGQVEPFNIQELNSHGSLFLTRPTLVDYIATPEELRWRATDVFTAAANGTLKVRIGEKYPLKDAGQAQADLASRKTTGKLILLPGEPQG
ncbi:quinone oxidoreductase family protein [Haematomicrobium sanguinis]|uniref:quinone oxidoreductase family protein n=1 Tax=Haematomicrobium sanguinis TaxID=479106 RepID=UPI00047C7C5B|nr:quinone oxidoreductase [Haematomicrobium sanguinis]